MSTLVRTMKYGTLQNSSWLNKRWSAAVTRLEQTTSNASKYRKPMSAQAVSTLRPASGDTPGRSHKRSAEAGGAGAPGVCLDSPPCAGAPLALADPRLGNNSGKAEGLRVVDVHPTCALGAPSATAPPPPAVSAGRPGLRERRSSAFTSDEAPAPGAPTTPMFTVLLYPACCRKIGSGYRIATAPCGA